MSFYVMNHNISARKDKDSSYQQRIDLRWVERELNDQLLAANKVPLRVVALEVLLVFLKRHSGSEPSKDIKLVPLG